MSDNTPTISEVRNHYAGIRVQSGVGYDAADAEFDRWLAAHDRQVAAKALEEAADAWHAEHSGTRPIPYQWLRARAAEYRSTVKGEGN